MWQGQTLPVRSHITHDGRSTIVHLRRDFQDVNMANDATIEICEGV
jgi:hypothetical protein